MPLNRSMACRWLVALALFASACGSAPTEWQGEAVVPPEPAPALEGTNWNGEPFRLADLAGRPAVVFFGYTFCPDICPFTLAKMKQVYAALGDRADEVAMVFVSVDPGRDTVEKLAAYVPNFDPRFYGIRIESAALDGLKERFGITVQYGARKAGPGTETFYYVDHTGTFFLYDREGQLRVRHPPNATAEALIPDVEALLDA